MSGVYILHFLSIDYMHGQGSDFMEETGRSVLEDIA